MNKQRRAELDKLITCLDELKADLENVRNDEQNAFDQMPESFQNGNVGRRSRTPSASLTTQSARSKRSEPASRARPDRPSGATTQAVSSTGCVAGVYAAAAVIPISSSNPQV